MKLRCFGLVLSVLVIFLPGIAQADPVGTVVEVEGTATLSKAGGLPFATKVNDTIDMGDVVATGAKSRLFILLADNTEWTLSENSKFKVDEYVYDPDDATDNKARYSVLDGGFRYVSGAIAHKANPDVAITSPAGTIGIRGTDLTGSPDDTGAYDFYVDDGAVDVSNAGATTRIAKGEGTMVANRGAAPGKPGEWKRERLNRLRGMLHLQREGQMRERIQQMQAHQTQMREQFRARAKERHEKMQERRGERQDERRQRIEQLRQQYAGGQGQGQPAAAPALKEKIEGLKEQHAENAAARQDHAAARKEAVQQRVGQFQQKAAERHEQAADRKEAVQEKTATLKEKIEARKAALGDRRAGRKAGDADDGGDPGTAPDNQRPRSLRNRGN